MSDRNSYLCNVDSPRSTGTNFDFHGPGYHFKPKAFVNPSIVKCSTSLPNLNVPVGRSIHINPNFRGVNMNLQQACCLKAVKKELISVHVNPYFHQIKTNSCKENGVISHCLSTSKYEQTEGNNVRDIKLNVMDQRHTTVNAPDHTGANNSNFNNFITSAKALSSKPSSQSSYTWLKDNSKSFSNKIHSSGEQSHEAGGAQNFRRASPINLTNNVYKYSNPQIIKTRHKIIHKNDGNLSQITQNVNSHYQVVNRYKIVNLKKLKFEAGSEVKATYAPKKDFPHSSRSRYTITNKSSNIATKTIPLQRSSQLKNLNPVRLKFSRTYKSSSAVKLKNLIKSKYLYINKKFSLRKKDQKQTNHENTKYKLDMRKKYFFHNRKKINSKVHNIQKLFPKKILANRVKSWEWHSYSSFKNKYWLNNIWRTKTVSHMQKLAKVHQNETVVNIGGIMYKATTNKLTRTDSKKHSSKFKSQLCIKTETNHKSGKIHHILYVRGEKFLLDENGKTLIRQPPKTEEGEYRKSIVRRVDIGGVTYVQKSSNVLIRTNTHQARHLVNYAKQKSISLLQNRHKRSNMPCMIYHHFGRCTRNDKGKCIYVHNPKNIALCKNFLKGKCNNAQCLLSHNLIKEKISTCHFFIMGKCNRENCPYLHVKVNKKAAICLSFLQGFCTLGSNCNKRHEYLCPEFDAKGICSRQSKCLYPHTRRKKSKYSKDDSNKHKLKEKSTTNAKCQESSSNVILECDSGSKKVIDSKEIILKNMNSKGRIGKRKNNEVQNVPESDCPVKCIPKKIKIDHLPLFIPLENS